MNFDDQKSQIMKDFGSLIDKWLKEIPRESFEIKMEFYLSFGHETVVAIIHSNPATKEGGEE